MRACLSFRLLSLNVTIRDEHGLAFDPDSVSFLRTFMEHQNAQKRVASDSFKVNTYRLIIFWNLALFSVYMVISDVCFFHNAYAAISRDDYLEKTSLKMAVVLDRYARKTYESLLYFVAGAEHRVANEVQL